MASLYICSKIHIFTDHNPLTYLTESMSKSAKLVRWSLALQTFDVDVKCTKGKLIGGSLSRERTVEKSTITNEGGDNSLRMKSAFVFGGS